MNKVYFISLGCPKNLVDSERIMGILEKNGLILGASLQESNIVIINTCGFIKPALKETEKEIKKILKLNNKKVYVYGCAVNRAREFLSRKFPEIQNWYNISERKKLIKDLIKKNATGDVRLLTTMGYAYLKIADGCSNRCSYCTIPLIKGEFKSSNFDDLINEARALAEIGTKELLIIAQDTAQYGLDLYNKKMIVPLIKEISKIKGIEWIRLLYAHPKSLTDELISEIKTNPKVCKYLDMPIQHINDRILKLMNRRITKKEILRLMKKLKGITLRTTIIAGFPTETESEFNELYDFLKNGYFDWFGVFKYCREKDTPAGLLNQLPPELINKRFEKLVELQQRLITLKNQQRVNKFYRVLVHQRNKDFIGHTEFSAPDIDGQIIIKRDDIQLGKFYLLKITGMKGVDLYAC
ncbi:MAG: 30S ribosomal protein S12 methylthiotransferase RimO [candidate division WOR-3 bacterium]